MILTVVSDPDVFISLLVFSVIGQWAIFIVMIHTCFQTALDISPAETHSSHCLFLTKLVQTCHMHDVLVWRTDSLGQYSHSESCFFHLYLWFSLYFLFNVSFMTKSLFFYLNQVLYILFSRLFQGHLFQP